MAIHGIVRQLCLKSAKGQLVYLLGETHSPTDTHTQSIFDWLDQAKSELTLITELPMSQPVDTRWGKLNRCDTRLDVACKGPLFSTKPDKFLSYPQSIGLKLPVAEDHLISSTFSYLLETLHRLGIMKRLEHLPQPQRQIILNWIQEEAEIAAKRYFLLKDTQKISNLYHQMLSTKSVPMDVWITIEVLRSTSDVVVIVGYHHLPKFVSALSRLGYVTTVTD